MNSISTKEIESQLLFFSKESLKHLIFDSKCGIPISQKTLKKFLSETEYNKMKELNPIHAIYKKAKPNIYYSKHSKLWDESNFKKDLCISSNALMTLSLLKLADYYAEFKDIDDKLFELSKTYIKIAKMQLDFYYNNLRNTEGFFVDKKNTSSSNTSFPDLIELDTSISYSGQAYMMLAYYMYSTLCDDEQDNETFKNFSIEILEMFDSRKELIYSESLDECSHLCYVFNIMYSISHEEKSKNLLLDMSDFIHSQYLDYGIDEKDMSLATMTAFNLYLTYKNTGLLTFKESFDSMCKLFINLYNDELNIFIKPNDKKDIKYYNIELILYLINLILQTKISDDDSVNIDNICNYYKSSIIHSNILTSFPTALNLDNPEKYKHFSSKSEDLLDDLMFCLPDITTPEFSSLAPIYLKSTSYAKKKSSFSTSKTNFESDTNMFLHFVILDIFLDDYLTFIDPIPKPKIQNSKSNRKNRSYRTIDSLDIDMVSEPENIEKLKKHQIEKLSPTTENENLLDVKILNENLAHIDFEDFK
ncbi:MAG: hypothetical protein ACRC57_15060 [Sarcina sp.]